LTDAKKEVVDSVTAQQASEVEAVKTAATAIAALGDVMDALAGVVNATPGDANEELRKKLKDETAKAKEAFEKASAQVSSLPDDSRPTTEAAIAKLKAALEGVEGYEQKVAAAAAATATATAAAAKPAVEKPDPAPVATALTDAKREVVDSVTAQQASEVEAVKTAATAIAGLGDVMDALAGVVNATPGDANEELRKKLKDETAKAKEAFEKASAQVSSLPDDSRPTTEAAIAKLKAALEGVEGYEQKVAAVAAAAATPAPTTSGDAKPADASKPTEGEAKPKDAGLTAATIAKAMEGKEESFVEVVAAIKQAGDAAEEKAVKKAAKKLAKVAAKAGSTAKKLREALGSVEGDVTKKQLKKIKKAHKKASGSHEKATEVLGESSLADEVKGKVKAALEGLAESLKQANAFIEATEKKLE
jgi:hypothetical protein